MAYYHVAASLPGGGRKTVANKSEADVLTDFVLPFLAGGTITTKWGRKTQTRQALELRIYATENRYNKGSGQSFDDFIKNRKNRFPSFQARAEKLLGRSGPRVFVVMPIQGEKYGSQEEQRIFKEYDERFAAIEEELANRGCVVIRIDKEIPLDEGFVERIKEEIERAAFVVADLTDERQSCYYELGYADALRRPVICIASKDSVIETGTKTKIHFDIHRNVLFFTNHSELREKLAAAVEKNRSRLLAAHESDAVVELAS